MTSQSETNWRKALLQPHATLHDAIRVLNDAALRIALVATADDVLVGTITDGDIRRGLLRGLDLQSPIDSVIHRDAVVVPPGLDRDAVVHLMQANKLQQVPVVDAQRRLLDLYTWENVGGTVARPHMMIVMAGGEGTRLRPHTAACPKPLLPLNGKPMLQHILERAKGEGFSHFVFAINYLGHMIEEHFGDGRQWQVQIDYLREDRPLGTAGALSLLDSRPSIPFLVTNGDVLTHVDYGALLDFHCRQEAVATMAVRLQEWQSAFGVVRTKGLEIVGFDEKPIIRHFVNAGIYVLQPEALDVLDGISPCDMPVLFNRLRDKGQRTLVYPMHEPWLDVGRPEDYLAAQASVQALPHGRE